MNGKMLLGKPIFVALAQRGDVRRTMLAQTHSSQVQLVGRVLRVRSKRGGRGEFGTLLPCSVLLLLCSVLFERGRLCR